MVGIGAAVPSLVLVWLLLPPEGKPDRVQSTEYRVQYPWVPDVKAPLFPLIIIVWLYCAAPGKAVGRMTQIPTSVRVESDILFVPVRTLIFSIIPMHLFISQRNTNRRNSYTCYTLQLAINLVWKKEERERKNKLRQGAAPLQLGIMTNHEEVLPVDEGQGPIGLPFSQIISWIYLS